MGDRELDAIQQALQQRVCICKGIPLRVILPYCRSEKDLARVHAAAGSGTGGCKGRRCSPKILALLDHFSAKTRDLDELASSGDGPDDSCSEAEPSR